MSVLVSPCAFRKSFPQCAWCEIREDPNHRPSSCVPATLCPPRPINHFASAFRYPSHLESGARSIGYFIADLSNCAICSCGKLEESGRAKHLGRVRPEGQAGNLLADHLAHRRAPPQPPAAAAPQTSTGALLPARGRQAAPSFPDVPLSHPPVSSHADTSIRTADIRASGRIATLRYAPGNARGHCGMNAREAEFAGNALPCGRPN